MGVFKFTRILSRKRGNKLRVENYIGRMSTGGKNLDIVIICSV